MEKMALICQGRSGSSVLIRSIDQHPDILLAGEVFIGHNPKVVHQGEWQFPFLNIFPNRGASLANRMINFPWGLIRASSYMRNFFRENEKKGYKVAGFKLMLGNFKYFPTTRFALKNKLTKRIVLNRENPIEIVISTLKAIEDGYSHLKKDGRVSHNKVKVDIKEFLISLERAEKGNEKLRKIAKDHNALVIKYNELFDWDNLMKKIFDYLEVDPKKVDPVLKKRSKKNVWDNVSNSEEVISSLRGTKYEKFI